MNQESILLVKNRPKFVVDDAKRYFVAPYQNSVFNNDNLKFNSLQTVFYRSGK